MKKTYILALIVVVLLVASCSPSRSSEIMIPTWLRDDWGVTDGVSTLVVSCKSDNIQVYFNGQLEQDYKSSLAMNPHVIIDSQSSTDNSYQLRLYNTITSDSMTVTFLYTQQTDTVRYTESYTYGSGNSYVLGRL